jgi:hypothetical protein
VKFLRSSHVTSFRVSPKIARDRFIAQPLTEGSYPIIIDDSSTIFVAYSSEAVSQRCTTLHREKGIRIADCR